MSGITKCVQRIFGAMVFTAMIAGFSAPVCAAAMPVSATSNTSSGGNDARGWLPLRFPEQPLLSPTSVGLISLSNVGSVFNPADGIGIYAGLHFDLATVLNGYAMGVSAPLPATDSRSALYADGGNAYGVQMMLADGVRFNFGQAFADSYTHHYRGRSGLPLSTRDSDSTDTLVSGLTWDFNRWGGISLTTSQTHVRDVALGNAASAMDLARMASLGVSAHVGFGDGWVTSVSYNQASLKLSLNPGFESDTNPVLHRQSFGIAVAKTGLFGHDALGLSLSRPSGDFSSAPHLPKDVQFQFYGRDKLFAGKNAQETDIGLGYVTSFLNGPIALQANASYQLNALGQNKDSLTIMSRAKIKF